MLCLLPSILERRKTCQNRRGWANLLGDLYEVQRTIEVVITVKFRHIQEEIAEIGSRFHMCYLILA